MIFHCYSSNETHFTGREKSMTRLWLISISCVLVRACIVYYLCLLIIICILYISNVHCTVYYLYLSLLLISFRWTFRFKLITQLVKRWIADKYTRTRTRSAYQTNKPWYSNVCSSAKCAHEFKLKFSMLATTSLDEICISSYNNAVCFASIAFMCEPSPGNQCLRRKTE